MNKSNLLIVMVALLAAVGGYLWAPQPIRFRQFSAAEFVQQLTPLLLVALLIERSLEVFLTTWRGGAAAKLQRGVDRATALAVTAPADASKLADVHNAQDVSSGYKADTQQIAMPAALILGILISTLGIRSLGNLVDPNIFASHPTQHAWFTVADVLLTGSLVGGGSDVVHSFMTALTNFMNPPKP
jgi:hypothetical protein